MLCLGVVVVNPGGRVPVGGGFGPIDDGNVLVTGLREVVVGGEGRGVVVVLRVHSAVHGVGPMTGPNVNVVPLHLP